MPGSDWIGRGRVGRVGSRRLGRGLEPACAGKGPSRAAAPAPTRVPPGASGGAVARVTECCRPSPRPALGAPERSDLGFQWGEAPAGLTGAERPLGVTLADKPVQKELG